MIRRLWAAGLVAPLLLIAVIAAILGFFATQQLAGPEQRPAQLSVVPLPATPTTPSPSPTASAELDSGTGSPRSPRSPRTPRSSRCPAGCECSFPPPNGIVIVCQGR